MNYLKPENVKHIVVHCSDSPQGRGDNAEKIHRWHLGRKWDGIGYHAVILEDGTVENGRPLFWPGAHVLGHNDESVGVCLIGKDSFTTIQKIRLYLLLHDWQKTFPHATVCGHRDLDKLKTCPNFDVQSWLYGEAVE